MNIHSIRDFENNTRNNNRESSGRYQSLDTNSSFQEINSDSRMKNCWNKFKAIIVHIFPGISHKSITFVLILGIIVFYFTELIFYRVKLSQFDKKNSSFQQSIANREKEKEVFWSCTLYTLGSSYPPSIIINHEFWRVFSAVFSHANFSHLFGNLISICFISFFIEEFLVKKVKYITLFILSGYFGNILSGILELEKQGVGASGSIFGLYGFLLLVFIFHYKELNVQRRQIFFYFLISFVINFLSSFNNYKTSNVGVFAHLGGFICGLIIGFFFLDLKENHLFLTDVWMNRLILCQKLFFFLFLITLCSSTFYYLNMSVKDDYLKKYCEGFFN